MKYLNLCKVCGANLFPFFPWGEDGQTPTYDICPCCGTEFGYEDSSETGILNARQAWCNLGQPWLNIHEKPENWDPIEQINWVDMSK